MQERAVRQGISREEAVVHFLGDAVQLRSQVRILLRSLPGNLRRILHFRAGNFVRHPLGVVIRPVRRAADALVSLDALAAADTPCVRIRVRMRPGYRFDPSDSGPLRHLSQQGDRH